MTSFATPTWQIGGLLFNADDTNGTRWTVSGTTWYDLPDLRTFLAPLPRYPGEHRSTSYFSGRPITINGWVQAPNKALREQAHDALLGLQFQGGQLQLTVADDYSTRWAMVELVSLKATPVTPTGLDFQLVLVANDPRKYSLGAVTGSTPIASTASGLNWGSATALNSNTGFESGISPWTVSGGAVAQSTTQKHTGTYAAKITPDGVSSQDQINSELVPITGGLSYTMGAWVWFTAAVTNSASVSVNWYDSSAIYLSSATNYVSVPATTWTQLANAYVAPAGAAYAQLVVALAGTPPASNIWYADDASITVPGLDWATGGGLNWGSASSSGTFPLTNPGTADSWPILTLAGPLTNPVVTNTQTGQQLAYTGTLIAGDVLVLTSNPLTRSVLYNGVDRRINLAPAQWFSVGPSSTVTLALSTSNSADTGTVTGLIYPAYW